MKRKVILGISILLLAIGFTGCKGKSKETADTAQVKNYVYSMKDLDVCNDNTNINQFAKIGNDIYAYGYVWSDNPEGNRIEFYQINEDGSTGTQFAINLGENTSYNSFAGDAAGNMYCIMNTYLPSEDNPEEYLDEYFLLKRTMDGQELFSVKMNEISELDKLVQEKGYFSCYQVIVDGDVLYVSCMGSLVKFDLDGNFLSVVGTQEGENSIQEVNLLPLQDGRVLGLGYDEMGMNVSLVDIEKGITVGEKYKFGGTGYDYNVYAGIGYDLYLVNSYGIYGYNLGDEDKTQILSNIDSDFDFYMINSVLPLSDTEFYGTYDDSESYNVKIAKFTKVPPSEVKEKQVLTLAMAYTDWGVRKQVIKFNKESDEYRIKLVDYSALYATQEDYTAGLTRLNTDIASGKTPDIILIDTEMPIDSYISKGLFVDLKPYMEKDEELDINNFMPNILEAFSVNGKYYTLVPSYNILTIAAKTSDVGPEKGWTVKEAQDILASKPEGTEFLPGMTKNEMLINCMNMAGTQFIDKETGKCSFDSEEFIQTLEFINTFPKEIGEEYYNDEYWQNYDSMWRDGRVLASTYYLGDFRSYNYMQKGTFGEKVTLIGFPSGDGDGSVIMPSMQIAISSKSKNKDAAWAFLRGFLTDEYQSDVGNLPLSIKRMEELADEATQRPYYYDDKTKVEYDEYVYINGVEVMIEPMTAQEADEYKQLLYSFTSPYRSDSSVFKIIEEETASYFAGQKSAKDVATIIQSRAQLYINESR